MFIIFYLFSKVSSFYSGKIFTQAIHLLLLIRTVVFHTFEHILMLLNQTGILLTRLLFKFLSNFQSSKQIYQSPWCIYMYNFLYTC